jgi:hypothetical protein
MNAIDMLTRVVGNLCRDQLAQLVPPAPAAISEATSPQPSWRAWEGTLLVSYSLAGSSGTSSWNVAASARYRLVRQLGVQARSLVSVTPGPSLFGPGAFSGYLRAGIGLDVVYLPLRLSLGPTRRLEVGAELGTSLAVVESRRCGTTFPGPGSLPKITCETEVNSARAVWAPVNLAGSATLQLGEQFALVLQVGGWWILHDRLPFAGFAQIGGRVAF